jgi:integrase
VQAKLTKQLVDRATSTDRELWVWDTEIRGFGLRVRPSGRKSYVVEYRPGEGGRSAQKRRYTIGQHGSPWTPDAARKKAIEILAEVIKGKDPAVERREARSPDQETVAHFVEAFVERYAKKQQRSWRETERTLQREFLPRLGKKSLKDVSRRDIAHMIDQIVDRAPVAAHRTFAYVRRFFNWCIEQGFLDSNPCAGLKPPPGGGQRDRILNDEELAVIWCATNSLNPLWEAVFQLLILTAQRKSEVVGMEWTEIDEAEKLWRIPGRRTKNGRAHEVPLTPQMLSILSGVPRIEGAIHVFTANGLRPMAGQSRVKQELDDVVNDLWKERGPNDREQEQMPHWTIHDLRRTATTGMARLGIPPHVADAILNHKSGTVSGVAAVYNRYGYLAERREALEAWEGHVSSLVGKSN